MRLSAQWQKCHGHVFLVKMNKYNVKNTIYILYTVILDIFVIAYIYLIGTIKGNLVSYHMRAMCNEKKPNIPVAEGGREARSHQHKS